MTKLRDSEADVRALHKRLRLHVCNCARCSPTEDWHCPGLTRLRNQYIDAVPKWAEIKKQEGTHGTNRTT